jgi:methanol--5-hydroxybenzimidazolylcobamide Co-methyltransferase
MKTYHELAIKDPKDLIFGVSPKPLTTRHGMVLGGGLVYPELNFTLPPMLLEADTLPQVRKHYEQIVTGALERAAELEADGVQLEFETLPPMTENPEWGLELAKILLDKMEHFNSTTGLKSVLRMTPNDTREMVRPPQMRSGELLDNMLVLFEESAKAGAELLSIESVGGKEIHDEALTFCDIRQIMFSLCVMGVRDMRFLWTKIAEVAKKHNVYAAGDTACGFGNTAMVLAEKNMIPRSFAAIDRTITAVRSLVAYECGAVGPGKDCGYENPFLKAITGFPMAMEGKTAACAHLSQLGNIAAATCDVWSNESVENARLLSGMAPTAYMEQLIYDCRLMNEASKDGRDGALLLQKWLVNSDASRDPQAFILTPENVIRLAQTIVDAPDHYNAGKNVALETVKVIREGAADGAVAVDERELMYLDMVESGIESMPDSEADFAAQMMDEVDTSKFIPADYDL